MRSSIAIVALAAAFVPATFAVTINGDGITWAPGEECSQQCVFKQFGATTCGFDVPFSEAQTCACKAGDFVQKLDACVQADCPDQHDVLKPEIDGICAAPTSTESPAPGQTGIPELTLGDACGIYCALQASEEAEKVDKCPIINQDENACVCASSAYATTYDQCIRAYCGSATDRLLAAARDDCPAGSTPPPNSGSSGPSGTGGPSRTGTAPSQSSSTGAPQESKPGDAGVHAAAVSFGAAVVALTAFIGLA